MHRVDDVKLRQASVRNLELGQPLGDHADHLAPSAQRTVGDSVHQAHARASVHEAETALRKQAAELGRTFGVLGPLAGT